MWYVYEGTTDYACPRLYKTRREMLDAWHSGGYLDYAFPPPTGFPDEEPVTLYSSYGCGFHWPATASRSQMLIASNQHCDDFWELSTSGEPDWAKQALADTRHELDAHWRAVDGGK